MDRDDRTSASDRTALLHERSPGTDAARVRQALAGLEPLDREVVVLHFRDRLSVDEIASLTESSPSTVTRRLRRGARAVEASSGPSVELADAMVADRDEDEAVADIALGITPQLASRLRRAVTTGDVPVLSRTVRSRRRLRIESWFHERIGALLNAALVAGTATLVVTAVAGPL